MGAFNLREPERHIEKLETYLMKNGIRADKEKVKELVGTFKKGDAKILYLRWLEAKRDETGDPAFVPSYVDTCGWLVDKYGKEKTTSKTLERIARKSRKKGGQQGSSERILPKHGTGKRDPSPKRKGRTYYDQRKDSWIATVGLLAEATTSKKIRKMDEGRGNLESSDSESKTSSSDGTSDSSESNESSSSSSSENERVRRRKKRIEKGKEKRSEKGKSGVKKSLSLKKVHRERREERKEARLREEKTREEKQREERDKEVRMRMEERKEARLREEKTREEKQREERDKEVRMRMEERHDGSGGSSSEIGQLTAHLKALTLTVSEMAKLNQGVGLQGAGTAGGGTTGASTMRPRPPYNPDKPKNCYVCDSTEHMSRVCPVFDEMVKLGWPLKRDKGMIVIREDNGTTHDIGHGYGRGGVAGVLVKDYPHLQKKTLGEGVEDTGQSNAVEGNAWREWSKKFIEADGGGSRSKTTDKKIVVDERSWEGIMERVGVDGYLPLNVFVATKGWLAKGISKMSLELARAHLEAETGVVGNVVMPLDDLIGVADRMNERDRRAAMVLLGKRGRNEVTSSSEERKHARIMGLSETSASSMSLDDDLEGVPEKTPTVIPAKVVAGQGTRGMSIPADEDRAKIRWDPKQNDGKSAAKAGGKRAKASIGGKVAPNVKPAASKKTPVAEVRKSAAAEIAAYVVGQEVAAGLTVGMLAGMPEEGGDGGMIGGEMDESEDGDEGDDEMEYYETSVASLTGESKYVEVTFGDVRRSEVEEVGKDEMVEADGALKEDNDIIAMGGRRNKPEKWPKKRALLAQCPHLAEVEVVSLEDGLYIPRVPNDDGSQINLVARGLALEIEKRGVKIDWEFKFNMRSSVGWDDS
ncbi:hypothetical protein BC829DRAFT_424211 [Chytridium lagenaria]|nr:hypothetical protein BC829DRAFT_424211 [Chytridium lagenaria]